MNRITYFDAELAASDYPSMTDRPLQAPTEENPANLVSSLCQNGMHRPVLDIDIPVRFEPSSTPGHGHLYVEKDMSWADTVKLMEALASVGLVDAERVAHSKRRGAGMVRMPGCGKLRQWSSAAEAVFAGLDDDVAF